MKHIAPFLVITILLLSCQFLAPQPVDMDAVNTAAYDTAIAMISSEQTMIARVATATYPPTAIPTLIISPTPSITPSPFPAEIASLLQDKCEIPWGGVTSAFTTWSPGIIQYGDKGCRLPIFSPNRKYLAYATLERPENQDVYVETIKILQIATG
ncbi:MAG TPA: hypothetical protein VFQ13_25385, partial [Anaerolineales bacterium]|nr:hypothetical protein [Anaerolineales bacterium]